MLPKEYEAARLQLEATLPPLKTPGLELVI